MRHLLLAAATALALVAASSPARAQVIIIDGSSPGPHGFVSIRTPTYYGSFAINNGVIVSPPNYQPFGYPTAYPGITAYPSYPSFPGPYPFSPSYGYRGYPGYWRP